MARLFVPAVLCPVCKYPNDHCFRFCQMCGYKRLVHHPVALTLKDVDLPALDARLSQLQMLSLGTPYAKQKSSLKSELEAFLYSLTYWQQVSLYRNAFRHLPFSRLERPKWENTSSYPSLSSSWEERYSSLPMPLTFVLQDG